MVRIRKKSIAWYAVKMAKGIGTLMFCAAFMFVMGCVEAPPIEEVVEAEEIEEVISVEVATSTYTYDVPLANEVQLYITTLCEDYHIDPALVIAMISVESDYDAEAVGDGGDSIGLMQIQEKWHAERMARLGVTDLSNPYQNVTVGIDYLAEKLSKGKGLEWALMAYNGGDKYADEMVAAGKVSNYANKVGLEAYKLTVERNEK